MSKYKIQLEKGNKITLPKEYIDKLALKVGETMTIDLCYKLSGLPYLYVYPIKQEASDIL